MRLFVVDALRGAAIVLMLLQHSAIYLLNGESNPAALSIAFYVSRISFPLFLFLAGFSVCLSGKKKIAASGKIAYVRHLTVRVISLFALGFLVNVIRADSMSTINILHIIAMSILLCGLTCALSSKPACITIIGLLLLYSIIGPIHALDKPASSYDYLLCLFTKSEYPPGMWFAYSFVGLWACWLYGDGLYTKAALWLAAMLVFASGVLILLGKKIIMYENTAPFLLMMLAVIFMAFYSVNKLYGKKMADFARPLTLYGRHSLSIYIIHQFLFITMPTVLGIKNSLSTGKTIIFFVFFLFCVSSVASYLDNKEVAYY